MRRYRKRFFFNEFVTSVLFGTHNETDEKTVMEACQELLDRVAFVEIEFTSSDALVVEKNLRWNMLGIITTGGGLLSLYAGFSALSLAEIIFWILVVVLKKK